MADNRTNRLLATDSDDRQPAPEPAPILGRLQRVRILNDQFRRSLPNRNSVISLGISQLPADVIRRIGDAVLAYDGFDDADLGDEHSFGAFAVMGQAVFFEIQTFDLDMIGPSPDPTVEEVTQRVLTITLAHEY